MTASSGLAHRLADHAATQYSTSLPDAKLLQMKRGLEQEQIHAGRAVAHLA